MVDELGIRPPLSLDGSRWRRRTKLVLGYTARLLMPGRTAALLRGDIANHQLSPADRLIVGALVHNALKRGVPFDHFAHLHQGMWRDDSVTAYHAAVEDRFTRWYLPHQAVVVDALMSDLAATPGRFPTLCEIGTGSGVLLDHLVDRLRPLGVTDFIGLDLSPQQVHLNQQRFPRCRFVAGDATAWIPQHAAPGWIFLCCGGVLEYFPRTTLAALLRHSVQSLAPVRWVVAEPIASDHDQDGDPSKVFGFESTWSHPYPTVLRQAGLRIIYRQEVHFDSMRWQLAVAGT
jgi:hypothetical protein